MTTFDRWEGAVQPPEDYLMHFRTKGSKNGIRRYQTESGEWTPLGLAERRKREGFGESRKERRAQRQAQRSEKRQARKAAATARKAERSEAMRKRTLKGLTDAEMKQKLERAKMEAEYRDLKRKSSMINTGVQLVGKYLEYRQKVSDQQERRFKMQTDRINAKANKQKATAELVDTIKPFSKGKIKAKADLIKAKNDRSKNTIRGAISNTVGNMIRKEGNNVVKAMPDKSMLVSGGKKVTGLIKKAGKGAKDIAKATWEGAGNDYLNYKIKRAGKKAARKRDNPLKG